MKKKILAARTFLLAIFLLLAGRPGYAYDGGYHYRFDDISGPSGRGAQWVVVTGSANSVGAPFDGTNREDIITSGNIVNSRSPIYISNATLRGIATEDEAISFIFAAFPGTSASPIVEFAWRSGESPDAGVSYTQDVTIGEDAYASVKIPLPSNSGAAKRFQFDLTKRAGGSSFGTERTYMRFHQNPDYDPSQTLQIPFVLANVANGSAQQSPLLFRAVLRDLHGDITAYDHFEWTVDENKEARGDNGWIFVPLASENINSNSVNYRLVSNIRNFSGIRYGLDRYDMMGVKETLRPHKWTMDLPANVRDVSPDIKLQELSHIPPGLITVYDQSFDVVSGRQNVFRAYAIDPVDGAPLNPFDLTLVHPPIFGVNRGESTGDFYHVTGFQLLPSDINFLQRAASSFGGKRIVMPSENIVDASSVSGGFITADAAATVKVNRAVPENMMRSNDVTGVLPLHITLNLSGSNRFISPKWNELLEEFKKSGNVLPLFAKNFSLYSYLNDRRMDVFKWLADHGSLEKTVKVFVDEEKGRVTLSFVALLLDGGTGVRTLHDSSAVSSFSYDYITIGDGKEDDAWDISFYVAPLNDSPDGPDNPGGGSGSGGGCSSGIPLTLLFAGIAALSAAQSRKKR
jgi:hypothetical protein